MSFSQQILTAGRWAGAAAIVAGLAGCAGNGAGLNSNGAPVGSGSSSSSSVPLTADFDSIQANVLTPICTTCHSGAGAPKGLMLDAGHSYNLLVGVPSSEEPTLDRVKPGDPTNSYIIVKLTNGDGIVGGQMPLGETPLPQATIDVIEQWIANGAQPSAAADNATQKLAMTAFGVSFTSPEDEAIVEAPVTRIVVAFNREVDASLVNYTTLTVEHADGTAPLPSALAVASGNSSTVVITPAEPLTAGVYRVTARGSGGGALADLNAQALGTDYSFTFTVDGSP